jgi:hypothetical protein
MEAKVNVSEFHHSLVFVEDDLLPGKGGVDLSKLDSGQTYLREVMHFNDAQVHDFRISAETFFRDAYGLDFTGVSADSNNIKNISGAVLLPFRFAKEARYFALFHDNTGDLSANNLVRDGGLLVMITAPGVTYHGKFGGASGSPSSPGELVLFGFYNVTSLPPDSDQSNKRCDPIIISYHALSPVRITTDGDAVIHCGLQHESWGTGVGRGVLSIAPTDADHIHVVQRNVLTFPGSLVT